MGARVAELADALDSKSSGRKPVWVRLPPLAPLCYKDLQLTVFPSNKAISVPVSLTVSLTPLFLSSNLTAFIM